MSKKDTIKGMSKELGVRQKVKADRLNVSPGQALKNKRGFAMVIALLLVLLIMVYSMDTLEIVINMIKNAGNIEAVNEAYYAAESAMERGLLANKLHGGPGYEKKCISSDTTCASINYDNGARADWTIIGRATCLRDKPLDPTSCVGGFAPHNTFYIPRPGTGNAGEKCDPLRVYPDDTDGDGQPDAGHPCNWGKIHYEEIVSIPLYTEYDSDGDGIKEVQNPSDLGIYEIKLKMRTPCKTENPDGSCSARYELNAFTHDINGDGFNDDTIVLWQIQGSKIGSLDTILYLLPDAEVDEYDVRIDCNSEIFEGKINDPVSWGYFESYQVLHIQSGNDCLPGSFGTLLDIGIDQDGNKKNIHDFITNINKPILTFQVISSLIDRDGGGSIPYLEYQLEINGDDTNPPADMYQTVVGEGYSQSFKQSVEAKKGMKTGILKFVISN